MLWIKIALFFFVFGIWISNGVSELKAQQSEKTALRGRALTWLFMTILPILLGAGIALWHWPF